MAGGDSLEAEKLFGDIKQAARLPTSPEEVRAATGLDGNYELLNEIHRGGQGVVFRARQRATKRIVAIKFMRHGAFATPRERFRFEREVDLASRLNHPDIVTIFDGGIADGQPYCVMEHVDGQPLNAFAPHDGTQWRRSRHSIELFERICLAVGYAHSTGVIHRDLKPANILVDSDLSPKVLDFGLAKTLDVEPSDKHHPRTITGEFVGTLAYASPEQVRLDPGVVDTRSDVYSLGVILYEFLTGNFPYEVDGSLVETLNHIAQTEPVRPTASRSDINLDLETIVLKCLAKEPGRRYQNATMLAEDLRRYLDGRPIEARRDSTIYVLQKTLSRHRSFAAGVLGLLLILVMSLITVSTFYFQAVTQRDAAKAAKQKEKEQRELEVQHRKLAEFRTYSARIAAAEASINSYATHDTLRNLYRTPPEHRGWEYWYLYGRNNLSTLTLGFKDKEQYGHHARIRSLDYHPNGRLLATVSDDGSLVIWDTKTEAIVSRAEFGEPLRVVRFHPQGDQLAVAMTNGDVHALTIDLSDTSASNVAEHRFTTDGQTLNAMQFSSDGKSLMVGTGEIRVGGAVLVFDWESGKLRHRISNGDNAVLAVSWSSDSRLIAYADHRIVLHDLMKDRRVHELTGHDNWITSIDFRPDGKHLVSTAYEPVAKIWGVESGRHLKSLFGHTSFVTSAEYSADSQLIATGSADSTLRIWNARNAAPLDTLWGQYAGIEEVSFNRDSQTIATCGTWCAKTWDFASHDRRSFGMDFHTRIRDGAIGPDSNAFFTSDLRGRLNEFRLDLKSHVETIAEQSSKQAFRSVDVSGDGERVAWACDDGCLYVADRERDATQRLQAHRDAVSSVSFAPEDEFVYSSSKDGTVRKWHLENGESTVVLEGEEELKRVLASPCGRWLAVGDATRIQILDTASYKPVRSFERERFYAADGYDMAFSDDGEMLVAPTKGSNAVVWSMTTGKVLGSLVEHSMPVCAVDFSPCGTRVVTSSREGTVKLWDTTYFQVVLTLQGINGYAETIEFSPDGQKLVGGLYDGSIQVWETMAESKRPKE